MKIQKSVLIVLACVLCNASVAKEQLIDEAVAFVADRVITKNELSLEVSNALASLKRRKAQLPPDKKAFVGEVLQNLIVRNLQLHEAERSGIVATPQDVDRMIEEISKSNKLSIAQMREQLEMQGVDYADFRKRIQEDFLIREVQSRQVVDKIEVSDDEIRSVLNTSSEDIEYRYTLWRVSFNENDKKSSAVAAKKIKKIRKWLINGKSPASISRNMSADKSFAQKRLHWTQHSDITPQIRKRLTDMTVDQVSPLLKTENKYYLLQLNGKRGKGEERMMQKQYKVRHIVIQPTVMADDETIKKRLARVKRYIAKKDNFAQMAERYSNDPGSNYKGGDLGWINADSMVPEFAAKVKTSSQGELIGPFRTQFGWHILEVLDSRDIDVGDDVRRSQAIAQIRQQRAQQEIRAWILRLREKYYVDVKV